MHLEFLDSMKMLHRRIFERPTYVWLKCITQIDINIWERKILGKQKRPLLLFNKLTSI